MADEQHRPVVPRTVFETLPKPLQARLHELALSWRESQHNAKRDPHGRAAYGQCADELVALLGAWDNA